MKPQLGRALNKVNRHGGYAAKCYFCDMKRVGDGIAILTVLWFLITGTASAQLNINHYMRVGQTRISIGNFVGAIEYFNIVIRFKPFMPEPYFYRGVAKHMLEDYHGAIQDYDKAIVIKPYYPDAYTRRGMAYHALEDYPRAILDYDKALEFNPRDEGIFNNRGIAKLAGKDVKGAIEDYDRALEINPNSTHALMNRSNAKIMNGDIRGAIQDLNSVILIRPHYGGAYLNRGLARFELNDYASALRDYDQCLRLEPGNAMAYNNRGIVKHKLEDLAGAIMDYDMALKLDPGMANAYFNRGMAREVLGRPGFDNDYRIAADLNPRYDLSRRLSEAEAANRQAGQQQTGAQTSANTATGGQTSGQTSGQEPGDRTAAREKEEETRRRRRLSLIVSDSRNDRENKSADPDDPFVQNLRFQIDLQPLFLICAFDKNSVNFERLQYYSPEIDRMNQKNNYYPTLSIANRNFGVYQSLFRNFILYFNEKTLLSDDSHNRLNRGIFHCLTGDYTMSLADLDAALKKDSGNALAWFSRGNCRFRMAEHIEQLASSGGLVSLPRNPEDATAAGPGNPEVISGDYELILRDYDRALSLLPGFFFGYYNRAYLYLRTRHYDRAMADLDRAIELEPEFAEAYFNRGLAKIYLDDTTGGAHDLSKAGELGLVEAYSIIKQYCN